MNLLRWMMGQVLPWRNPDEGLLFLSMFTPHCPHCQDFCSLQVHLGEVSVLQCGRKALFLSHPLDPLLRPPPDIGQGPCKLTEGGLSILHKEEGVQGAPWLWASYNTLFHSYVYPAKLLPPRSAFFKCQGRKNKSSREVVLVLQWSRGSCSV